MNRVWRSLTVLLTALVLRGCDATTGSGRLPAELQAGKAIVDGNCRVCHAQGINGAPILGNSKMWSPRLAQGEDTLVRHAIDGFNLEMMPPRGGNPALTDEQIRLAVRYMASRVTNNSLSE